MSAGTLERAGAFFLRHGVQLGTIIASLVVIITIVGASILVPDTITTRLVFGLRLADVFGFLLFLFAVLLLLALFFPRLLPQPQSATLPKDWQQLLDSVSKIPNPNCAVFHSINPTEYSRIAAKKLKAPETRDVFTVCSYEPRQFMRAIIKDYCGKDVVEVSKKDLNTFEAMGEAKFQKITDGIFPHFLAMRQLKGNGSNVVRIVLETDDGWLDRNRDSLKLFSQLNGEVDCFVVSEEHLRRNDYTEYLTDFVVFNRDEAVVDYYDDSFTLLITTIMTPELRNYLLKAKEHFEQKKITGVYKRLSQLIKNHEPDTIQTAYLEPTAKPILKALPATHFRLHSKSYLYEGFRHVGKLQSIRMQRDVQRDFITSIRPSTILSVGCGYGEELDHILSPALWESQTLLVDAVDLVDVSNVIYSHPFAKCLATRFSFTALDIFNLEQHPRFGEFDICQCGFLLHDVPWNLKDTALSALARSVRNGGVILVSEIFLLGNEDRRLEIARVYGQFISEANEAVNSGIFTNEEYNQLIGDGSSLGLLRSKADALVPDRHYYDTIKGFLSHVSRHGLEVFREMPNPSIENLSVIALRRSSTRH